MSASRKDPGLAAVLSLVVPGVGQIYNGDFLRGIFWLIVTPGFWFGTGGTAWLGLPRHRRLDRASPGQLAQPPPHARRTGPLSRPRPAMSMLRASLPVLLLFAAVACGRETTLPTMTAAPLVPDVHSFAKPADARVTHVALDLQADFAAHDAEWPRDADLHRRPGVRELVLDTRDLDIGRVIDERQQPLTFTLAPPVEHLGQALAIALPATGDRVTIEYRTPTRRRPPCSG